MKYLPTVDSEVAKLIKLEEKRQAQTLMMIPSENIASAAVSEAAGSCLGNKYAEGYPGKRYYQGQGIIDQIENLVIERAKKLFNVPYANVQALSGSPANFAIYTALLSPGDKIMGLTLSSGGHLTHGARMSSSSKYFQPVPYEVGKDGYLDYEEIRKIAKAERPQIIVAGYSAYSRIIDWKKFSEIAEEVDAYFMTDISHIAGLIAAGIYPSPAPFAHIIMTTTHKTLRGPRGALILTTEKGLLKNPDMAKKIDSAVMPGIQGGPHLNTIAAIGVALKEAAKPGFKTHAKQLVKNAKTLAAELTKNDFNVVSGGTDSHLLLIDLSNKNVLGNTAAEACEAVGIILNRNGVPFDPNPPFYPSGIRLGTPGITSRGMKENEMKIIARSINDVINAIGQSKKQLKFTIEDEKKKDNRLKILHKTKQLKTVNEQIKKLCQKFPVKKVY